MIVLMKDNSVTVTYVMQKILHLYLCLSSPLRIKLYEANLSGFVCQTEKTGPACFFFKNIFFALCYNDVIESES